MPCELAGILQRAYNGEYLDEFHTQKLWQLMIDLPEKYQDKLAAGG